MAHQPIISEAYTAAAVSVKKKKRSLLSLTPAFRLGIPITTLPRASALTSGYDPSAYHIGSIYRSSRISKEEKTLSSFINPSLQAGDTHHNSSPGLQP